MKVLVTGAAGMLGSGLVPALCHAGHEVLATDIDLRQPRPWGDAGPVVHHLDVREPRAVREAVEGGRVDLLCHLAAETSLERSDDHPDHAFLTNTVATKFAALACRDTRIPMVYISTAGVFDGVKDEPYHEWDGANPINTYGKTKYEGELYVENWVERFFIVRAGWMVGGGPGKDHKFVARVLDQIGRGATVIHAVDDKYGTPTYVPDFGDCLQGLLESGSYGRYHMACEGEGTRYDVARTIVSILGLDDRIEVKPVGSEFFAEEFPSARPRSEIMENMHLRLLGLNTMRPWQVALQDYIERNFASLIGADAVIDLRDDRTNPTPTTPRTRKAAVL